jgi:hypothetical protein
MLAAYWMDSQTSIYAEQLESSNGPDVAEVWTFGNLQTAGFGFKDGGYHGIRLKLYTNGMFAASCVRSFGILSKRQKTTEEGNWRKLEDKLLLTKQGSPKEVDLREYFNGLRFGCHLERVYPRPAGYEWFRILDIKKSYNNVYHRRSYGPHGPSVNYYPGTKRIKSVGAAIMATEKPGKYVFYETGEVAFADIVANPRVSYHFCFDSAGNPLSQLLLIDNKPYEGKRYCFSERAAKDRYEISIFFTNEMIKQNDPKYQYHYEIYEHGKLIRTDEANKPLEATSQ